MHFVYTDALQCHFLHIDWFICCFSLIATVLFFYSFDLAYILWYCFNYFSSSPASVFIIHCSAWCTWIISRDDDNDGEIDKVSSFLFREGKL